jgi:acylphosphatase
MVTKTFNISGQNVINVGMRPALLDKALEYDISVHATNIAAENKVRVIVNGDTESINEFVDYIKNNDIRINTAATPYNVSGVVDYNGPDIDWNRYEIRFMTGQMAKGFRLANEKLQSIENTLSEIKNNSEKL